MLDMKWGELLILITYALWYSFHYFWKQIWRSLSSELLIPYPWGQCLSCSCAPTPSPTPTLPSFKEIFFIPVLSYRITIISHTQKNGCYSMNHLFPQKTAWPFAKKVDSTSGETAKTIRKLMQLHLQNPDVSHRGEIFLSEAYFQQVFFIIVQIYEQ